MSDFCERLWGFHMSGHGEVYWRAINAYDTSYEGIRPEDFCELNHFWDERCISFITKNGIMSVPYYKYDPDKEFAAAKDFHQRHKDVVKDIRGHWKRQNGAAQGNHLDHLRDFYSDEGYQQQLFTMIWRVWSKHDKDRDGLLQKGEINGFLKSMWGKDVGGWAKKYWEAINAYNSTYQGICPEDFLECWIRFDWDAADFMRERSDKVRKYRFDAMRVAGLHAHNFNDLKGQIVNDIRNHWKG